MFLDIWPDSFDIVHLSMTFNLKVLCKVLTVSFVNGYDLLFDYENGVHIEWPNSPVSENQRKEMWHRLNEVLSYKHINYNLTSETGFSCESLISYIKSGRKNISEVTNFVVRYPVRGPMIIFSANLVASLINAYDRYDVRKANEFEIILWLLSRVPLAIVNSVDNIYDYEDNNNNNYNNNNNNNNNDNNNNNNNNNNKKRDKPDNL